MKKVNRFSLTTSIVMLCLVTGNTFILSHIKAAIEMNLAIQGWMGPVVAVLIIAMGLFHLWSLIYPVWHFRSFRDDSILRAATFVLGIFSMVFLTVDIVMLQDIGKEYMLSFDISHEWIILFINHGIHAVFSVLMFIQCFLTNQRIMKNDPKTLILKDEAIFLTVHQIGIFSCVFGLMVIGALWSAGIPQEYIRKVLCLFIVIILIPYGLSVGYWLFTKRKEKLADWYDEKQFLDISRGALITLVLSVLIMTVFFVLSLCKIIEFEVMIWLPIYLFLTLLTFSGSTLYFNKRA